MHEYIVDTLHDAVPFHPHVVTVAVGPVPVDPDPFGTTGNGLLHHDGPRRWRCCLGGRRGLRFLNHDDRLSVDLLLRAGLGLDDYVGRRVGLLTLMPFSDVAIVGDIELVGRLSAVAVGSVIVGGRGNGAHRGDR
jgi:hypothetical protein